MHCAALPSSRLAFLLGVTFFSIIFGALPAAHAAIFAGYSEYYIPGRERQMWDVFSDLDVRIAANLGGAPQLDISQGMHTVISITVTGDDTTVYYDHWEDGYDFDPNDPDNTADQQWVRDAGDVITLTESNIPVNPRGTAVYYDGGDRIYIAGTSATVSRTSWAEDAGPVFAISWELFPVKPFLTDYTIPVGRDIAVNAPNYSDFERVYILVQSVTDGNTIQIDDPTTPFVDVTTTLNRGETTELFNTNAGTHVTGSAQVQVHFIVGSDTRNRYEARGFNAMPEALWDNEYYSPVGGFTNGDTDIYLYNPHSSSIIIFYEDSLGQGAFVIPAKSTVSYQDGAGRFVPIGSGVYLTSDNIFWGISSADAESRTYDWGFSLVPVNFLTDEYYLSWAPGTSEAAPTANGSPAFVTPIFDDTIINIDFSPTDGIIDQTVTRNRLETIKVFDPDNDNSGMRIFASAPIAVAWGQDPDTAGTGNPYLDLGTANLPMPPDWIDLTLGLEKTADPTVIAPVAGQQTRFTLVVSTYDFPVKGIAVQDVLPAGFSYVNNSTVIQLPDNTALVGVSANPAISGQTLTWDNATLNNLDMAAAETLTITYDTIIDGTVVSGQFANAAQASGSRLLGSQVFSPFDNAIIDVAPLVIDKDSITKTVSSGGTAQYTVKFQNISDIDATGVSISDTLPAGFSVVSTDSIVTTAGVSPLGPAAPATVPNPGDTNLTWGPWDVDSLGEVLVTFTVAVAATVAPDVYDNTASADATWNGSLVSIDDKGEVAQDLGTPSGEDPEDDEDVEVVSLLLDMDTTTDTIAAGGQATYVITVQNDSTATVSGVDISASLPPGFTYASTSSIAITDSGTPGDTTRPTTTSPSVGDVNPQWGTWNIGPGDAVTITLVADVAGSVAPGTYDASAFADSPLTGLIDDAGPVAGDIHTLPSDTGTDEDVTVETAVLTIDKDAVVKNAVRGSTAVTWQIVVANSGTADATNVVISDTLPAGFAFNSNDGAPVEINASRGAAVDPSVGDTVLTWERWTIQPGGSVTVRFIADVAGGVAPGSYDNTAEAGSDQTGLISDDGAVGQDTGTPPLEDPEDDEDVFIFDAPTGDLAVSVAHTQDVDTDFIDYLIDVINNGPSDETGPTSVTVTLPPGIDYLGFSGSGWSFVSQSGQDVTFSYTGTLPAGSSLPQLTVNTEITAPPPANPIATATVSGVLPDLDLSNNTGADPFAPKIADLSTSTKTVSDLNGGDVEPGDVLAYTITLVETGGKRAKFVSVTDDIPPNVNGFTVTQWPTTPYTDDSTVAGSGANGTGILDINNFDVPKNSTMEITFQVTVDLGLPDGAGIDNQAVIDNPRGAGASPSAPTIILRASALPGTGTKPLYLFGNTDLSRQVPSSGQATITLDNTNNANAGDPPSENVVFTLVPALQQELRIDSSSGNILLTVWLARQDWATWRRLYARLDATGALNARIGTYLNPSNNEVMPDTPTQYNIDIPIDTVVWPAGGPDDEIVLPAGTAITLTLASYEVTGASAGNRQIIVHPDEGDLASRSQVRLTANSIINVDAVTFYDDAYPAGALISSAIPGTTVYIRADISDPFGFADVTGATLDLIDPVGTVQVNDGVMTAVADNGTDSKTFEYEYTVPLNAELDFWMAYVTGQEGEEGTVTDIGQNTINITTLTGADLAVSKTHSDTLTFNQTGDFTIRVTNNGPEDQTANVVVTDTIPAGMSYVSSLGSGWTVNTSADPTITWTYSANPATPVAAGFDLPPIALIVLVGDSATAPSTIQNTASVNLGVGENNPGNNASIDTVNILALGVDKSVDVSGAYYYAGDNPGDELTYTVTVTNSSDGVVRNIDVTDNIPPGVTYVPASTQVTAPDHPIRVTEYFLGIGTFSGTTYDLILNHDLVEDYFVIIQGSDGDGSGGGNTGPRENYVAIVADPFGTGDLTGLSRPDAITLERGAADNDWLGVVTVVESIQPSDPDGFQLLDVVELSQGAGATSGSGNAALGWSDIDQVVLFGSANGAGCRTGEASNNNMVTCWSRLFPSGASQINWTRNAGGATLGAATATVMATQWGGNWDVQRARVNGTNGGDGANAAGEYNTQTISSVTRANTWVWGTGHTDDNGLGDGAEGMLITLGNGVNQNTTETTVAVASENNNTEVDVDVYVMSHPELTVDYRFKADGDTNALTVDQTVDAAQGWRMAQVTNGSGGTGTAYPRPLWSARYTADDTVRLERRRSGQPFPAWLQGVNFSTMGAGATATNPGGAPPTLISADDGYSLLPGESLMVTFKVVVDNPFSSGPLNNAVLVTADGFTDTAVATQPLQVRTLGVPDFTDDIGNPISGGDVSKPDFEYTGDATQPAFLKLVDNDRNADIDAIDTVVTTVTNPDTGDSVTVTLYETGPDTGIFTNDILGQRFEMPLVSCEDPKLNCCSDIPSDPQCDQAAKDALPTAAESLWVQPGTTPGLQLVYEDPADSTRDTDTATAFIATAVVLSDVGAYAVNGESVVYWETASEVGTAAFNVLRKADGDAAWQPVNERPLASLRGRPQGGVYRLADPTAVYGDVVSYLLEELEISGRTNRYGPFNVTVGDMPARFADLDGMTGDFHKAPHAYNGLPLPKIRLALFSRAALSAPDPGTAIKISVTREGLVFIGAPQIATLLGIDDGDVINGLPYGELVLTRVGKIVPYQPAADGSGLYFYGAAIESPYTDSNVYWLRQGSGLVMTGGDDARGDVTGVDGVTLADAIAALKAVSGVSAADVRGDYSVFNADVNANNRVDLAEAAYVVQALAGLRAVPAGGGGVIPAASSQSFTATVRQEQDLIALTDYFKDPAGDFWVWGAMTAGDSPNDVLGGTFYLEGWTGDGPVSLSIDLFGGTADNHCVQAAINLVPVGDKQCWSGVAPYRFEVPDVSSAPINNDGTDILSIQALTDNTLVFSTVALDGIDATYPKAMTAIGNMLTLTGDGAETVTIDGFASPDITVFDVADPDRPRIVTDRLVDGAPENYRASFRPADADTPYIVVVPNPLAAPDAMVAIDDSDLTHPDTAIDYLVIAPASMTTTAQALADYRASQGLASRVAAFEEVVDAFNNGFRSPEAIRNLLAFAVANWQRAPQFVVLAGNGTYDHKNAEAKNDNLIPTLLVGTPQGLFASDQLLADVGPVDGLPDLAIGRLPALDEAELTAMIDHIIAFESGSGDWRTRVIMSAGTPEFPGEINDFTADSDSVETLLPDGLTIDRVTMSSGAGNTDLMASLNTGAALFNYLGHGGYDRLAGAGLLTLDDIPGLTNNGSRPVLSALTCIVGNYGIPGIDALGESMLKAANGGAIAVWSPSGLSINEKAVWLNQEYVRQLRATDDDRLGSVILNALHAYYGQSGDGLLVGIYNLLGDPALRIPVEIIYSGEIN